MSFGHVKNFGDNIKQREISSGVRNAKTANNFWHKVLENFQKTLSVSYGWMVDKLSEINPLANNVTAHICNVRKLRYTYKKRTVLWIQKVRVFFCKNVDVIYGKLCLFISTRWKSHVLEVFCLDKKKIRRKEMSRKKLGKLPRKNIIVSFLNSAQLFFHLHSAGEFDRVYFFSSMSN
jgi:hypothetical protein